MVNGKQKGCKKILVLYTNFGKHRKPEKTNWVMHQYHLGELEEEKEGELVVSKIFYQTQPRQCNWSDRSAAATAAAAAGEGLMDKRRDSGSGSCSSKEMVSQRDELTSGVGISGYGALEIQQNIKPDNFSFAPFRKSFDEVCNYKVLYRIVYLVQQQLMHFFSLKGQKHLMHLLRSTINLYFKRNYIFFLFVQKQLNLDCNPTKRDFGYSFCDVPMHNPLTVFGLNILLLLQ